MSTQEPQQLPSSPITTGESRLTLDLARFSLDTSWRRVSDSRNKAYPSPPMSGSPSQPARHKNEFDDRGYGEFGGPLQLQGRAQAIQHGHSRHGSSIQEHRDGLRMANAENYSHNTNLQYGLYQIGSGQVDQQYQYPAQPQSQMHHGSPQLPLPSYQTGDSQPSQLPNPFVASRPPVPTPSEPTPARKTQRKTKGHVASACVPCKRAHLRCDAGRPCSRCINSGKEASCIDMQHKKRGRPRLRDDRDSARFEPSQYNQGPELMRRPPALYPNQPPILPMDPLMRSHRILKSQGGSSTAPPRFLDHASIADANVYPAPSVSARQPQSLTQATSQAASWAYLNMDLVVIKATKAFSDSIGMPLVLSRKLQELVKPSERNKIDNLQRALLGQRQKREQQPKYLPPIVYGRSEDDRVIQSVGFSSEDIGRITMDRTESFAFQSSTGEQRQYEVRIGLGKRESTFFIALKLDPPPQQPSLGQYNLTTFPSQREQQFGYQGYGNTYLPQHQVSYNYPQTMQSPSMQSPAMQMGSYDDRQDQGVMYRPMMSSTSSISQASPSMSSTIHNDVSYSRPSSSASASVLLRNEYQSMPSLNQPSRNDVTLRNDMLFEVQQVQQATPRTAPEEKFMLPPILNQGSPGVSTPTLTGGARDDRSGRLDIGGLLEKPFTSRRNSQREW